MKKVISSIFVLCALAVGLSASDAFADHAEVTIEPVSGSGTAGCQETPEGCYNPMIATVDVGGKVIFLNTDVVPHVFAAGEPGRDIGMTGEFGGELVQPGGSQEWTPTEVGEVSHFCTVHPWMTGTIVVQAKEGEDVTKGDGMMGKMMDDMNTMMAMEDASGTGMLPDGTMVMIQVDEAGMEETTMIKVMFENSEHVNYDIMAMQGDSTVLDDMDVHSHTGIEEHMTAPLEADLSEMPLDITIMFKGYGIDEITGEAGEVMFTNVVPEFGTIAMLILAVAVVSVVVVTSKSRVIPRL